MILVGTDFSESASGALAEARSLSATTGMPVEVLHVPAYVGEEAWQPTPEERAWLEGMSVPASTVLIRFGMPWVELVRCALEREAAFIVAGSHGSSGFQPLSLGTTAGGLAIHAPLPVVLVSDSARRAMKDEQVARGTALATARSDSCGTPEPSEAG